LASSKKPIKKRRLFLGSKAQLIISSSRHNIYATLVHLDQPHNVIFTISGGQVREVDKSVNKRFKTSQALL